MADTAARLISASRELCSRVERLTFGDPVMHVYNPLSYASKPHERYLSAYGNSRKRVVFWGMNPGPWGMAQTGVPFGEIDAVRSWMGIEEQVGTPGHEHPKRPVQGFSCTRSEVSGRRLWGLFRERFGDAASFFSEHFVMNYCPLVFMEESGRNRTPDKLSAHERNTLYQACDEHVAAAIRILEPEWVIGIGKFAEGRLIDAVAANRLPVRTASILHPSPASPAANRGWAQIASDALEKLSVWPRK